MSFRAKFTKAVTARLAARASSRARLAATVGVLAVGAMTFGAGHAGAASVSGSFAQDEAHGKPRPSASSAIQFGIADPDLITETAAVQASQLAAMKAIGITSVRLDANWAWVQYGGPTSFDWSQLDQAVASVRAAGMSLDLIIDGCPPWAAVAGTSGDPSPQPASSAQYAQWAADVAARYAPQGVSTFEIWNEPNDVNFWQPKPNPAAYTADLVAAYASIKAVDPSAFVISGGLAPEANDGTNVNAVTFLQDMYADGAKGHFDALGYHPYSFPALPNTYESWSGWSQMSQTSPSIRSVMTSNGDSSKQIWITEVGAPSAGPDGIGQTGQATEFTQSIGDAKKDSWIGGFYIYSWQDQGTDTSNTADWFGLLTAAGAQKPAYTAVKNAIGVVGAGSRQRLTRSVARSASARSQVRGPHRPG